MISNPQLNSTDDRSPVFKFVNKMLLDAIKMGASHLHFEPYEKFYRVRFRINGMLRIVCNPPAALAKKITHVIKIMSGLDSADKMPQDGYIKFKISDSKAVNFRISTVLTLFGEKLVMRVLDFSADELNIERLGYESVRDNFNAKYPNIMGKMWNQKELYLKTLKNPYGMVLVTGPIGSGKTVSLYAGVNVLNKEELNISAIENHVEIDLPGVNYVQVNEKTGKTFAKTLKDFLRQNTDIILIGEISDLETTDIAIRVATTGRMVMSTMYSDGNAPQTLTRIVDMGVNPLAVAATVRLIIAQRLCRHLCGNCKEVERDISESALRAQGYREDVVARIKKGEFKIYRHRERGCEKCNNVGYKGYVAIYQVMPISGAMKRLIMKGSDATILADQAAKERIPNLRDSGLKKVLRGQTSLEEVNRVISPTNFKVKSGLRKPLQACFSKVETDNLQKRMQRDVENARKYALEQFATELLPVKDSIELGLEAATKPETDLNAIRDGMTLTLKMFITLLEKFKIVEINPQDQKFNPHLHEAMAVQSLPDVEEGIVIHVHQKGYQLNDRLLRPARVIVAKRADPPHEDWYKDVDE